MRYAYCLIVLLSSASLFAAEPKIKTLLVSIEKYEIAPLDYAENDIGKLAEILMSRYDCQAYACIDSAAAMGEIGADVPMKSIMKKIAYWCHSLRDDDTGILYLAGHGVKDKAGNLYLAMTNFDRKNFEVAAIPFAWIRDTFGNSKAANKLLLLDACFAGTGRNIDFESANNGEIADSLAQQQNVTTIASSRGDQQSWLWGEAKHSLFTYWLIEAFKGHADLDGDCIVTCKELVEYLQHNVTWVAATVLEKKQEPVVLNAEATAHLELPLRAIALSRLIDDIAEQIDLQIRIKKYSCIGVPEFTTGLDNTIQPHYGTLPRWISELLRSKLTQKALKNRSGYEVLNDNALRETFQAKGITPDDLGTNKTVNLKVGGKDLPLLVMGKLNRYGDAGITVRTSLLDTAGKREAGYVGGTAALNKSDLAMAGISAKFTIADSSSQSEPNGTVYVPEPSVGLMPQTQRQEVVQMQEQASKPHPLQDKDNKFDVWVEVRSKGSLVYKKRNFTFQDNNCYLPVSKGEEYRIRFKNQSGADVFVRLLVDGLNSLSQKIETKTKGAIVEAIGQNETGLLVVAPRVALEDARAWFVNAGKTVAFLGFYDANGKSDSLRRFRIVDADKSVAARKNYTEQIGLITIAFYQSLPPSRASGSDDFKGLAEVATGEGQSEEVVVKTYRGGNVPGEMLAVFNIRYMTPQTLETLITKKKTVTVKK